MKKVFLCLENIRDFRFSSRQMFVHEINAKTNQTFVEKLNSLLL